jgi:hypothetical protein
MEPPVSVGKTRLKAKPASRASKSRKPANKGKSPANLATQSRSTQKARPKGKLPAKAGTKPRRDASKVRPLELLTGGNPRIAKADGDAPVQAYIAGMPGWKRDIGHWLDALIVRNVPGVRKAVKWNSPFYGIEGRGWFLGLHSFTRYVKVAFFRGTSLRPPPPGASKSRDTRYIDIREADKLDEVQMAKWVKQAAALPGWLP